MLKVYIEPNKSFTKAISYTWTLFAHQQRLKFAFVNGKEQSDMKIGEAADSDFQISAAFHTDLSNSIYAHSQHFKNHCIIYCENGNPDLFSTCFYMVNSLQEYSSGGTDEIGRFQFRNSYQFRFGNITENLVQKYFDEIAMHPKLKELNTAKQPSSVFISHDIDNVTTAWIEDGFAALKQGQVHHLFRLLFNAAIQKPDWLNMDKIMSLHDEYSFKSTFFWLANQGRINRRMVNADYDVRSGKRSKQS
jgi:hypothetical protein